MSTQTFPTTIIFNYPFIKIPEFRTNIISYGNKVEQRIAMDSAARYSFSGTLARRDAASANQILAFFEARKGSCESFYLQSPEEALRGTTWAAGTVYTAGLIVRPTTINNRSYKCTVGGTSHAATEPVWPTTVNGTVADNTVTWAENTYLVRFKEDSINQEYFRYMLYTFGVVKFIQVSA
jgi:hypothetical protein